MLRSLLGLFDSLASPAVGGRADEHTLELATAVLLVEVMRAEPSVSDAERHIVLDALRRKFSLSGAELAVLVERAEHVSRTASDFHQFTSVVNERFGQPEKIRIVQMMWEVAYADRHLGTHENHVISRVAGLLHVTHGEYIAAKLRAQQVMGANGA